MKKLVFFIVILFSINCIAQGLGTPPPSAVSTTVVDSPKTSLAIQAYELIKSDSALQSELISKIENAYENRPEKGSSIKGWLIAIFTLIIALVGAIVSKMHLKKSYWYLQLFQVIGRFIINHLIAPENKKNNIENHKI
jgi:hypothetical protein